MKWSNGVAVKILTAFAVGIMIVVTQCNDYTNNNKYRNSPKIKEVREEQILQENISTNRKEAVVSYYDESVCWGRKTCKTASGENFNPQELTVASRTMQFGTRIQFYNGDNNVVCRVNDRGPFVAGREFDLSFGCASALGIIRQGVAKVLWEELK
jgi:rare lipoprotein A (peptidoglycan hydrolase)